jgi:hypothetical protein
VENIPIKGKERRKETGKETGKRGRKEYASKHCPTV